MASTRVRRNVIIGIAVAVGLALLVWAGIAYFTSRTGGDESGATPSAAPTVSQQPASELPTPTPGSTQTIDPPAPIEVPIDEVATPVDGVDVSLVSMEPFEVTDAAPGEYAGPALRLVVSVTNESSSKLDLAGASVTLAYGEEETPAADVGDPATKGLPRSIAAGASATGEYSFTVPLDKRGVVRVTVDLLVAEPEIVFRGPAPQ